MFQGSKKQSGFTLVEVLVTMAISVVIFGGLFASVQYSLKLVSNSGAKLSALSLANDRMEYFRSLPYSDVGTIAGIPSGAIAQNSTTSFNGIEFAERVLVEYVDDPADGQLTATTTDSNGIPADYKRLKIEITWNINNATDTISLISNIVPRSIETTDGGGTVRVNVIDADSTLLPGAEVRLVNDTTTSTIDIIKFTDASGVALFSGAPAASNYEVTVTAPGYSTDQTYEATTTNPNPITAPFSVLESDISTVTFQIGELSDIDISTLSSITEDDIEEMFTDTSGIATSTDVEVNTNKLILQDTAGVYPTSGTAFLQSMVPSPLIAWDKIVVVSDLLVSTSYIVQLYTGTTSTYSLISDTDLPGNGVGFSGSVIDISALDATIFTDITIGITLSTTNTAATPEIDEISTYYRETETVRGSVGLTIQGNKTIGTKLDSTPIYKVDISTSTNVSGEQTLTDIEFDTYQIDNTDGYLLARACSQIPLQHLAGTDSSVEMLLVNGGANTLRVSARTNSGDLLPGADVTLSHVGFSVNITQTTDGCGQVFFDSSFASSTDYAVSVDRNGYATQSVDPFSVDGKTGIVLILIEN